MAVWSAWHTRPTSLVFCISFHPPALYLCNGTTEGQHGLGLKQDNNFPTFWLFKSAKSSTLQLHLNIRFKGSVDWCIGVSFCIPRYVQYISMKILPCASLIGLRILHTQWIFPGARKFQFWKNNKAIRVRRSRLSELDPISQTFLKPTRSVWSS